MKVYDRPGIPQGPLDISEIEADAMTLNWRAPKDNGGSDISNYVVEKRQAGSSDWQRVTSSVLSTNYRVRGLEKGRDYEFRVMAENQYGISDSLQTLDAVTARNAVGKIFVPIIMGSFYVSNIMIVNGTLCQDFDSPSTPLLCRKGSAYLT